MKPKTRSIAMALFRAHCGRPLAIAHRLCGIIILTAIGIARLPSAHGAALEPKTLLQIQAATYEVVAAKPVGDNLTYIRSLPLELLPFQERNDKYYSIGTAFSLGGNRFVTAAHVLDVGIGSLWGPPALRDAGGQVLSIDKIEKFSLARDFAVFSVTGNPKAASLKTNVKPTMNTVVYTVGNALGTGIVVRDGLLTSATPEEQDGRWNWLRFSAAASPGNSGGPLLDNDGTVIGIVLRKSPNENLNFALPIEEVLRAPEHVADFDSRGTYQIDMFDTVQNGALKAQFALPLSLSEFSAATVKLIDAFSDSQLAALLAKEPDKVFPNGAGSVRLLHSVAKMPPFPAVIFRKRDGEWALSEPKTLKTTLAANGYVTSGSFGHELLFRLRKPDDLPAASLYADPEALMNQLLKSGTMQRIVGTEKIQVTGLGKPNTDDAHIDAWQRRWQVRVWPLPFANEMFVTLSLPMPDGYVTIARYAAAGKWHGDLVTLEASADFICVGYSGGLAQWKEFLASTAILPAALKTVKVDYDYQHRFSFDSPRVSFAFTQKLQAVGQESQMSLGFDYLDANGKVRWDVGDIRVQATAEGAGAWLNIQRHIAPPVDLDDAYKSSWDKIVRGQHPFDGVAHAEGDTTRITGVVGARQPPPPVLYTAFVGVAGNSPQSAMQEKLDDLLKNVHVGEH